MAILTLANTKARKDALVKAVTFTLTVRASSKTKDIHFGEDLQRIATDLLSSAGSLDKEGIGFSVGVKACNRKKLPCQLPDKIKPTAEENINVSIDQKWKLHWEYVQYDGEQSGAGSEAFDFSVELGLCLALDHIVQCPYCWHSSLYSITDKLAVDTGFVAQPLNLTTLR